MKNIFRLSFLLLFLTASCRLLYKEGDISVINYPFEKINTVIFDDVFNVWYIHNSVPKITIEGREKHLEKISLKSDNGKVKLSSSIKMQALYGYGEINVYLYAPTLDSVIFSVAGYFTTKDTLKAENFHYSMSGDIGDSDIIVKVKNLSYKIDYSNGYHKIEGEADDTYFSNRGMAVLDARNHKSKKIKCEQNSTGDCHIKAIDKLNYSINLTGNIYQYGKTTVQPTLIGKKTGTGELIILK